MQWCSALDSRRESTVKRFLLVALLVGAVSALAPVTSQADQSPKSVTCGDTISAPGKYVLAGDCTGTGISIVASNVELRLQNHTMTGSSSSCLPCIGGIYVGGSNVQILGPGTVRNYWVGVFLDGGTSGGLVSHLEVDNSGYAGIETYFGSNGNVFDHNIANHNNIGIQLYPVSTGNAVAHNNASGNGQDLADGNSPPCDHNDWEHNDFTTANQSCIH